MAGADLAGIWVLVLLLHVLAHGTVGRALSWADGGFWVAMTMAGGDELCGRDSWVRCSTYGIRQQSLLLLWV